MIISCFRFLDTETLTYVKRSLLIHARYFLYINSLTYKLYTKPMRIIIKSLNGSSTEFSISDLDLLHGDYYEVYVDNYIKKPRNLRLVGKSKSSVRVSYNTILVLHPHVRSGLILSSTFIKQELLTHVVLKTVIILFFI